VKIAKIVGSSLLFISFFLPWVDVMISTVSGMQIPGMANEFGEGAGYLYLLYLIPLLAIAYCVMVLRGKNAKILGMITGIFPLLVLVLMVKEGGGLFTETLAFGFYLTGLSALIVLISSLADRKPSQSKLTQ